MLAYHDTEWGLPLHDDRKLFEYLLLDGAQAGLSWLTIIRKREGYRRAFDDFNASRIAAYGDARIAQLLQDPGIIRNRQKVNSAIRNARAFLEVQRECGGFANYLWEFVGNQPIKNSWKSDTEIPAVSPESEALSQDLRRRGFNFVGPTIIYAFMQGAGLVNDHLVSCFRHHQVS
jgi:DNA-3-methyladenine glycosylase I